MSAFIQGLTQRLAATFDPARAGEALGVFLTGTLVAAAVMLAYYVGWRILEVASRPVMKRIKADATSTAFVGTILKYSVLAVGLLHALDSAGMNTASLLASLGVVGLTVGFAARDALSNVVSGILIYWDRPFVIGDLVDIAGSYGRVSAITLRSTRVITSDGRMLAVPNTEVISSTVASYTNFPHLRVDIPVTIGVGEEIARARALMLSLVTDEARYLLDPEPRVVVKALNDYNNELELQVWIHDERRHLAERFDLRERIYDVLSGAGVEMPFETIRLEPLEVRTA